MRSLPLESLKKKVLVAESDDIVRGLLAHILHRKAFLVHTASTEEEADSMLQSEEYDAIIAACDGTIGGLRLVNAIAEKAPHRLPRTIVTTVALSEAEPLRSLPLHAIVKKPVEIGDFVELVQKCVRRQLP